MFAIDLTSRMLGRMLRLLAAALALIAVCLVWMLCTSTVARADRSYTNEVIRLVNVERSKVGVPALQQHQDLCNAADVRAEEAARSFSHTRPNGSKWRTVFDEHNVQAIFRGENLAFGQPTPETVVDDWMASKDHRKNILNKDFDYIAVGLYEKAGVLYWSQLFIQAPGTSLEGVAGVEDAPNAKLAAPKVSVGGYALVVEGDLNVRVSGSTKAQIVAVAEVGSTLAVLEIKNGWAYIQMSCGTEGWVSIKYLAVYSEV